MPPNFEAALRDVRARDHAARVAAAERLATPEPERKSEALSGLLALAEDIDARVRAAAVRGLQELGDGAGLPALLARLADGDPLVRELAVVALGRIGGTDACNALRTALRSRHAEVRFQAPLSYLEACAEPQLSALTPLMRDEDPKVRANTARCLAQFGDDARAELRRAVSDADPGVRVEAALALARLGEPPDAARSQRRSLTRSSLGEVLDAIGTFELQALRAEVVSIAESVFKPLAVKVAAARALLRLGDARGVETLRSVMRAFRSDGRSYAVQITGELEVVQLVPELVRLSRRLRGVDPGGTGLGAGRGCCRGRRRRARGSCSSPAGPMRPVWRRGPSSKAKRWPIRRAAGGSIRPPPAAPHLRFRLSKIDLSCISEQLSLDVEGSGRILCPRFRPR